MPFGDLFPRLLVDVAIDIGLGDRSHVQLGKLPFYHSTTPAMVQRLVEQGRSDRVVVGHDVAGGCCGGWFRPEI
jgi:hypothetical protein